MVGPSHACHSPTKRVSSSKEKIEAAKKDWAAGEWEKGRFQLPFGDADEFIPLPDK